MDSKYFVFVIIVFLKKSNCPRVITVGKQFATVISVVEHFTTVIAVEKQFVTILTGRKHFMTVITAGKNFKFLSSILVLPSGETFLEKKMEKNVH